MKDILRAFDDGNISVLTLLDLSAAFDTINHELLLSRLEILHGISSTALSRFEFYLSGRTETVTIDSSKPSIFCFGVQQGAVLGPAVFTLYTKPLSNLIERHSISSQFFVDDTQLLDSCHPDHLDTSNLDRPGTKPQALWTEPLFCPTETTGTKTRALWTDPMFCPTEMTQTPDPGTNTRALWTDPMFCPTETTQLPGPGVNTRALWTDPMFCPTETTQLPGPVQKSVLR